MTDDIEANARRAAAAPDADASDIPPALTPTEWTNVKGYPLERLKFVEFAERAERHHAMLALLNDDLHDEDVRKITREHVELLRYVAGLLDAFLTKPVRDMSVTIYPQDALANSDRYSELLEFADVIESYLPPADEAKR